MQISGNVVAPSFKAKLKGNSDVKSLAKGMTDSQAVAMRDTLTNLDKVGGNDVLVYEKYKGNTYTLKNSANGSYILLGGGLDNLLKELNNVCNKDSYSNHALFSKPAETREPMQKPKADVSNNYQAYANQSAEEIADNFIGKIGEITYNKSVFGLFDKRPNIQKAN